MKIKKLIKVTLLLFFVIASYNVYAVPGIQGQNPVTPGVAYTYTVTQSGVIAPMWNILSGTATINSTSVSGNVYTASITWTTAGVVEFFDEVEGAYFQKSISLVLGAPTPVSGSRCGTGTVVLSATPGSGGSTIRWYTASSGGTYVSEGTTYTTSSISTTTTYYITTRNNTAGVESSPRTSITATVNSTIGAPSVPAVAICSAESTELVATLGTNSQPATTAKWYTASSGGTLLATATSYTTPSLTSTTTYYVTTYDASGSCESSPRTSVTVTVNALPSGPDAVTPAANCATGTVTLSATPHSPATSIRWYTSPTDGDLIYTGTSFTTPTLNETTVYYAASYNTGTSCASSTRSAVTASINMKPAPVYGLPTEPIYGSGTTEMMAFMLERITKGHDEGGIRDIAIDTTKYEVNWYGSGSNALSNTSRLAKGVPVTSPSITQTTRYYIRVREKTSSCWGDTTSVSAVVTPLTSKANIQTDMLRITGKKTEASLASLPDSSKVTTFTYLDGIGRPQQQVVLRGSPNGKDIIAPMEYDKLGRSPKRYLPYVATTTDGSFQSGYMVDQQNFYQASNDKIADDNSAFAISKFEDSPLGRQTEQGGIGLAFQPGTSTTHTQKVEYLYNSSSDNVRKFYWNGVSSGYYPAKTLTKTKTIDPDGDYSFTFTDGSGNTVLVRQFIDKTIEGTYTDYLETYYIYNDLGQLNFIVSPKGVAEIKAGSWSFTQTIKDSYANQFKYDDKGRVIEKKVPGQAWQYIVYDPLGRVVLTQDGMLRTTNQWAFMKYDYKGRAVITGLYTNTSQTTRAAVQAIADTLYSHTNSANLWYEKKGSTNGYTNVSFPVSNTEVLVVSYYDNYDFDNSGTDDRSYVTTDFSNQHAKTDYTLDLATGTKQKVLGTTSTWLYDYVFYDARGRVIQTQSSNYLSGSVSDRTTNMYYDDGRVHYSKKYHDAGSGRTTSVLNTFTYDIQGRLTKVYQKNNSLANQLVVKYEYNELSQVVDKKLHGTGTPGSETFLQSVDYRYTIKGQLASINNSQFTNDGVINDDTGDYFGLELLYNTTESGLTTTQRYDGMISAMKWKAIGDSIGTKYQHSYAFVYDKTGKLDAATYVKKESSWNKETNALNETMTYDHNGNIKTLQRNYRQHQLSGAIASYVSDDMDDLTYSYNSSNKNNLEKVTDASLATGFDNGSSSTNNDYTYDANGNLLSDKNKGIDSVKYNVLGKPIRMKFSDGKVITYKYDAVGSKLSMSVTPNGGSTTTTDYVGGFVYVGGNLSFFGSPEGRVVKNGSNLDYEYSIADHQGNTRVVFTSATTSATISTADFEGSTNTNFQNYNNRINFELMDHTDVSGSTYSYSQKLTGASSSQVGIAKSMKVYPGDKVKIEAYAKYYNPSGTTSNLSGFALGLTGAFGVSSSSTGEALKAYNTLNNYGGIVASGGGGGSGSYPKLFVNILLFDKDFNFLDASWQQIDGGEQVGASPKAAHDYMSAEVTAKEEGYAYVYVSNESPTLVEFYVDDAVVTYTPSNVNQYNEYYPFGLQTSSSWTRENTTGNNYLYNAANELNKDNGWYEMHLRGYDPATGRMLQIDPYATLYASSTTYNYALNNPVMMNDQSGGYTWYSSGSSYQYSNASANRLQRINSMNSPEYYGESYAQFQAWGDDAENSKIRDGSGALIGYRFSGAAAQAVYSAFALGFDQGFYSASDGRVGVELDMREQMLAMVREEGMNVAIKMYGPSGLMPPQPSGPPIASSRANAGLMFQILGKITMPAFSILWSNYPFNQPNGNGIPVPQHPSKDSYARNQCAIRVGVALINSGVDMSSYPDVNKTSEGYPRSAQNLADWLWHAFKPPVVMSQQDFESNYSNKTGILYMQGVHIDLFNGKIEGSYLPAKTGSGYYGASSFWFWEIK